jgi:CheY-like chemotaxis protein
MDRITQERIFDPYFTTKEKDVGTGMGLAVVHGIVKEHGGAVAVDSEPGKGSTFSVYFPKVFDESSRDEEKPAPIFGGTERILFVDDEKSIVDLGRILLKRLGYQVTTKTSPVKVLEEFRRHPHDFDMVITDLTMPKMTGDKLADHLMEIRPDIPIILCTGFSERITEDTAKDRGIKGFVLKPIVIRELAETIRKVLDA